MNGSKNVSMLWFPFFSPWFMNDFSASLYDDVNPPQPEIEEGEEEEEEGVVTVEEGVGPSDSVISNVVSITDVNQNQG
jgi:hypothetical protein